MSLGFPLSFGVFQNHYSQQAEFANNPFIPIVGTIATGLSYRLELPRRPCRNALCKTLPKVSTSYDLGWLFVSLPKSSAPTNIFLGLICILGLSFATTLGALIVTQGIMYGLGFLLIYFPIMNMVSEYWIARRDMAFGLTFSASGFSGVLIPFVVEAMLNKYGYPTTLRAAAVALAALTGPLIPLMKGRLPPAEQSALGKIDWSFLRKPVF